MQTPLKVGITGGIGAGKTTVCRIFETLGVPIYYADERAKWLMVNELSIISEIKKLLGAAAYFENGALNRTFISSEIFENKTKLEALNAIVHPAVFRDWETWQTTFTKEKYTLREAALLVETGTHKMLDKLIVVTAPLDLRILRVQNRDGLTRAEVETRISRQLPEETKAKLADFLIKNDGSESLSQQVHKIHKKILTFIAEKNERS